MCIVCIVIVVVIKPRVHVSGSVTSKYLNTFELVATVFALQSLEVELFRLNQGCWHDAVFLK